MLLTVGGVKETLNRAQYDAGSDEDILPCNYFHMMAGTECSTPLFNSRR